MLRRYVALIEWPADGEPEIFTGWSLRRLGRRVAIHLDGYLREEWTPLPKGLDLSEILPLKPDDPEAVKTFLREVREIPDWGYPSFYRIRREDPRGELVRGFL